MFDQVGSGMTKQVLIVDDNPSNRKLLYFALKAGDYELHQAENGNEAMSVIEKTALDLALLDVQLPDIDGLDLARTVRQRFPEVLLIMLSVLDTGEAFERAFQAGANAYVIKPYNLRKVLELLQQLEQHPTIPHCQMLLLPNNAKANHYRPAPKPEKNLETEEAKK